MARILLLRPPALDVTSGFYRTRVIPPLALALLGGALRQAGHEPVALDALGEGVDCFGPAYAPRSEYRGLPSERIVERIRSYGGFDGIAVSAMFSQDWPHVARIVDAIAEAFPGTPIIAGGEHATATAEYLLRTSPAITMVGRGEGEGILVDFAEWLEGRLDLSEISGVCHLSDGRFVDNGARPRIGQLDTMARPAWDLFDMETYFERGESFGVERGRTIPILATRGCPYRCTFCSSPQMWTTRYKMRDPEDVVDEIAGYIEDYRVDNIDFYDLTAIVQKKWILAFCDAIERRGLRFTWQLPSGTRSEVIDEEVVSAIWRNGCRNITYAPESGSLRTLRLIKKKVSLPRITESIRVSAAQGLSVKANLIIGFPHERRSDVYRTMLYGWKLAWIGLEDLGLFPFAPYPGSELYEQLREQGKIAELSDDYFASLMSLTDMTSSATYCERISGKELGVYRFVGMAVFYALGYLRFPRRVVRSARNIRTSRADSVVESRLQAMWERRRRAALAQRTSAG